MTITQKGIERILQNPINPHPDIGAWQEAWRKSVLKDEGVKVSVESVVLRTESRLRHGFDKAGLGET